MQQSNTLGLEIIIDTELFLLTAFVESTGSIAPFFCAWQNILYI